jgi:hypothetical protein
MCPLLLSNSNKNVFSPQISEEYLNVKFYENPSSLDGVVSFRRVDRRTDMTQITVAFLNFSYSFNNIQLFEATQNNPLNILYIANKLIILNQYARHNKLKTSVLMVSFNPVTPELKTSAKRRPTRFFTEDLLNRAFL